MTILQQALNFTADDLKQNQQGTLSEAQKQSLMQRRLKMQRSWLPTLVVGIVIGGTGFIILPNSLPFFIGFMIVSVGLLLMALQAYLNIRRAVQSDIQHGSVKSVTGNLTVEWIKNRRILHIQDTYFDVPVKILDAFQTHENYTLYFAPESGVLLSAEHITGDML